MKRFFTKEVIIGLCVAVAILILCFGIEFLKGINVFKPSNFYVAQYENVEGLEIAAPVLIDGYKVGQVREINFNYQNPGKIEVLMALNKELHLPVDSKALIGTTLLSGSFIDIKLGQSSEMLPLGSEIMSGSTPDLMASLSNDVLPAVSAMVPKIDSLLVSVNNLVSDPALAASIKNIETITANLSSTSHSLNLLMNRQVPNLVNGANIAVTNLDTITANLNVLSRELNRLPLNQTVENVNGLTANLVKFTGNLNNPNSTLGELTQDSELYDKLNRLTADIDSLIIDIKKNPKRYISIKLL
ncbi:MAG: MCE family protein [Muribaculaceae bacterium]|nr:MCE family protein [Muribaculaceae bacterium]